MIHHLKKLDWIFILSALSLLGIGLLSLSQGSLLNFKKQLIFGGIGLGLMFLVSFLDWRILRDDPYLILTLYFICLAGLTGLFFFAPEIRGVKGWYKLGPIGLDPIEPTKIILLILLAKYFSVKHIEMYRIRHILLSGFYVLIPTTLIFFQPDLGSVLILIILWAIILLISGIKLGHFLILVLAGLLILGSGWSFLLQDYQKERIFSFIQPQLEPLGAGWSQAQAKIAIGSGGIWGQGIGKGTQTRYGFLPESETDFMFSALAEEMGLIGVGVLLILFSVLLWRIMNIALTARTNFPRLFATGFGALLFLEIFIHIGMNLGVLPIIGISLPLVSYGGSSLIMTFIGLGILQSIKIH